MPKKVPYRPTPEEDAEIARGIALDPDNPEWTEADFASARPTREVMPELVERYLRSRGKQTAPTKVLVSLRLDQAVVERLRESGPGWQGRANEMLRKAVLG
jgi:uncharacterized protein (DUF4415 family)